MPTCQHENGAVGLSGINLGFCPDCGALSVPRQFAENYDRVMQRLLRPTLFQRFVRFLKEVRQ